MAKILTTASLVTQSAPATPSAGFGTLYASGSSLYFKNSSGTNYDLSMAGSSSIRIYISSSATWTKPSNIQYIKVICGGAGGGGGGGRVGADGSTKTGGEGGAGGDIAIAYFSSQSLTGTTYSINLTGGGFGGTRTTSAGLSNGGDGGAPGTSSFSTGSTILLAALGGPRGRGGGNALGTGPIHVAPTTTTTPNPYPPFYLVGNNGAIDVGSGFGDASNASSGTRWLSGGGTGGRLFNNGTTARGGSGSAIYQYATLIQSGSPGGSGTGAAGNNGAPVVDILSLLFASGSNFTSSVFIGTGGHGGGSGNSPSPFTISGGDGGSGSLGAGGGGGGAAGIGLNTIFSGRGGPGGDGFAIIFEYF